MAEPALTLGYWLSSEEHDPHTLIDNAARAEQAGFASAVISDHYHPWVPEQGHSPFVWSVLGGIARQTSQLVVGTGVTAPILRMHPAIVAHAAATVAAMMPERFWLGVGAGERLNEHVTGQRWPTSPERRAMLGEAVEVIRRLFTGEEVNHRGTYFRVEHAQVYDVPSQPPPVLVAAGGRRSATLAGQVGDGLIGVLPDHRLVEAFEAAGGAGRPRVAQLRVCWAESEEQARKTASRWWPHGALPGRVLTELSRPTDFAALSGLSDEQAVAATMVLGPDPQLHLDAVARFAAAGFNQICVHQVGPAQQQFLDFYASQVLPQLVT